MFNAGLFGSDADYGKSVKTLTKSVAVAPLDNQNRTHAGQGTWKYGLLAEFIDGDK